MDWEPIAVGIAAASLLVSCAAIIYTRRGIVVSTEAKRLSREALEEQRKANALAEAARRPDLHFASEWKPQPLTEVQGYRVRVVNRGRTVVVHSVRVICDDGSFELVRQPDHTPRPDLKLGEGEVTKYSIAMSPDNRGHAPAMKLDAMRMAATAKSLEIVLSDADSVFYVPDWIEDMRSRASEYLARRSGR